jgi:hypothetical protein
MAAVVAPLYRGDDAAVGHDARALATVGHDGKNLAPPGRSVDR